MLLVAFLSLSIDANSRNKVERKKKIQKKEENEKKAKEQNSNLGYEESEAKTKKRHFRAKTASAIETKKTSSKKIVNGQRGKARRSPQNINKVNIKEEEVDTSLRAIKIRVKCEEANSVPRRRSVRLGSQH